MKIAKFFLMACLGWAWGFVRACVAIAFLVVAAGLVGAWLVIAAGIRLCDICDSHLIRRHRHDRRIHNKEEK